MENEKYFTRQEVESPLFVRENIDREMLHMYNDPLQMTRGMWVLCLQGETDADINLNSYRVRRGDMVTILPGDIVGFYNYSDDISLSILGCAGYFFEGVNVSHSIMDYRQRIIDMPVLALGEEQAGLFGELFHVLKKTFPAQKEIEHEIPPCLLVAMLSRLNTFYMEQKQACSQLSGSENLYKRFARMVMEHFTTQRSPSFYAAQLGVTHQHLNRTTNKIKGKSATDAIAEVVILDAMSRLKSSSLSIRQISESLGFSEPVVFSNYFKRYMGMTPVQYRKFLQNNSLIFGTIR